MKISINSKEFQILEKLGKGGNGQVFRAYNKEENKDYAIKTILIEDLNEEDKNLLKMRQKYYQTLLIQIIILLNITEQIKIMNHFIF